MTRYQLDADFDFDFELFGICGKVRDYKMAWGVNQALDISLVRADADFEISLVKNPSSHVAYRFDCEQTHISYEMLTNRGSGGVLLPEQRQADYLLLMYNNIILNSADVVSSLRALNFVSTAFEIEVESLKNKENLITN